jgi:hypothetical protein
LSENSNMIPIAILCAVVIGMAVIAVIIRRGRLKVGLGKGRDLTLETPSTTDFEGLSAGDNVRLGLETENNKLRGIQAGKDIVITTRPNSR